MNDKRIIFYIDAYSPETIPLAKLAEYMVDFAALLGKDNAIHFSGLEAGSTKIAVIVEFEDIPKVTERLTEIQRGNPSKETAKLFAQIDERLANDNAIGNIYIETDKTISHELLAFPGRDRRKLPSYGPFNQEGSLDGILISVGGKDQTVPLRLQNGEIIYANCDTTRDIARALGKHLFEPIRVYGTGRWVREIEGTWTLIRFRVFSFDVLDEANLRDAVVALRGILGSGWRDIEDPLAELADLRHDDDDFH